jgi:hypothetical protein
MLKSYTGFLKLVHLGLMIKITWHNILGIKLF